MRTSRPDIYAAGDVAEFFNPALETHLGVEHEDNANAMGEMAGRSMALRDGLLRSSSFFYSDLFELVTRRSAKSIPAWKQWPSGRSHIAKVSSIGLRGGRVRGVSLWNVWDRVDAARQLIAEAGPFGPDDLKGRLPELLQHA